MTKQKIINAAISLIRMEAVKRKLEVIDRGTGHAFENTIWNFKDDSGIPNVIGKGEGYSIELRSFWGSPEIDIRRETQEGEELLIFNFSDSVKKDGSYIHTGDFKPHEIRVDARWDYKQCISEVYAMIDYIKGYKDESKPEGGTA